jgi:hypothetical protein
MRHDKCSAQHARCNMHGATCSMHVAPWNRQHATGSMQQSACSMQHAVPLLRFSKMGGLGRADSGHLRAASLEQMANSSNKPLTSVQQQQQQQAQKQHQKNNSQHQSQSTRSHTHTRKPKRGGHIDRTRVDTRAHALTCARAHVRAHTQRQARSQTQQGARARHALVSQFCCCHELIDVIGRRQALAQRLCASTRMYRARSRLDSPSHVCVGTRLPGTPSRSLARSTRPSTRLLRLALGLVALYTSLTALVGLAAALHSVSVCEEPCPKYNTPSAQWLPLRLQYAFADSPFWQDGGRADVVGLDGSSPAAPLPRKNAASHSNSETGRSVCSRLSASRNCGRRSRAQYSSASIGICLCCILRAF